MRRSCCCDDGEYVSCAGGVAGGALRKEEGVRLREVDLPGYCVRERCVSDAQLRHRHWRHSHADQLAAQHDLPQELQRFLQQQGRACALLQQLADRDAAECALACVVRCSESDSPGVRVGHSVLHVLPVLAPAQDRSLVLHRGVRGGVRRDRQTQEARQDEL